MIESEFRTNFPQSSSTRYRTKSWSLRSSCSGTRSNFDQNPGLDNLQIWSLSTWTVPRLIRWSSGQTSHHPPFDSVFDKDSWRMCQRTHNLWLAGYGDPAWSFVVGFQSFVAVSRNSLNFWSCCLGHSPARSFPRLLYNTQAWRPGQCSFAVSHNPFETGCLLSILENTFLGLGLCFGQCPACSFPRLLQQTPNPIADSMGILETSGPKEEDCCQFKFNEIKHTDLGFATAGSFFHLPVSNSLQHGGRLFNWTKMTSRNMERFKMLTQQRRLHYSSRVKLPVVNKSASWLLVSKHLIWILGSNLILSNNPPNVTLWVLDTCLIIGLRPLILMTNLITASLSSKYTATLSRTQFPAAPFGLLLDVEIIWVGGTSFDECNTSITTSHRSRARIPSICKPASSEIISVSVELWDTDVCFLHIQLMGTNVTLPKTHKIHPETAFESSRSPAKSESWNRPHLQSWTVLPTWHNCRLSFVW